jgi:hypothetical protein
MKRISNHGQPIVRLRPMNETRNLLKHLRAEMRRVSRARSETKSAISLERRDPLDDGTPRTTDIVENWIADELYAWHDIERLCHSIAADAKARQVQCDARLERVRKGRI